MQISESAHLVTDASFGMLLPFRSRNPLQSAVWKKKQMMIVILQVYSKTYTLHSESYIIIIVVVVVIEVQNHSLHALAGTQL